MKLIKASIYIIYIFLIYFIFIYIVKQVKYINIDRTGNYILEDLKLPFRSVTAIHYMLKSNTYVIIQGTAPGITVFDVTNHATKAVLAANQGYPLQIMTQGGTIIGTLTWHLQ